MAIQTINIGNVVNDGLGDDLRTAFQKVNANFTDLSNSLSTTARNIGQTGQGIFAQQVGKELQFKNLVGGNKITLDSTPNSIVINASRPDAFTTIFTPNDSSSIPSATYPEVTLEGRDGVEITSNESTVTVGLSGTGIVALNNYDFGNLNGTYPSTVSFLLAAANVDFGTVTNPGSLKLDLGGIV